MLYPIMSQNDPYSLKCLTYSYNFTIVSDHTICFQTEIRAMSVSFPSANDPDMLAKNSNGCTLGIKVRIQIYTFWQ